MLALVIVVGIWLALMHVALSWHSPPTPLSNHIIDTGPERSLGALGQCGAGVGYSDLTSMRSLDRSFVQIPFALRRNSDAFETATDAKRRVRLKRALAHAQALVDMGTRFTFSEPAKEASQYIADTLRGVRGAVVLEVKHRFRDNRWPGATPCPSVLGVFPGSGETASERIVLCAHMDSINTEVPEQDWLVAPAPGADDNAAGCAVLLEVAHAMDALSSSSPRRTVELHFVSGEELGLRGSLEIAEAYAEAGTHVAAVVNFDIVGYRGATGAGPKVYIPANDVDVDKPLSALVAEIVRDHTRLEVDTNAACGYSCSDNSAYARHGFPATALKEGTPTAGERFPGRHTAADLMDFVDKTQLREVARAAAAVAAELAMSLN